MCFQKINNVDERQVTLFIQAGTTILSLVFISSTIILYFLLMRSTNKFMTRMLIYYMYTQVFFSLMSIGDSLLGIYSTSYFDDDGEVFCYVSAFIQTYFPLNQYLFVSVITLCFFNTSLKARGFVHLKERKILAFVYLVPLLLTAFSLIASLGTTPKRCQLYSSSSDIIQNNAQIAFFFVPLGLSLVYNGYMAIKIQKMIQSSPVKDAPFQTREKRQYQFYCLFFVLWHIFTLVEFCFLRAEDMKISIIHNSLETLDGFLFSLVFLYCNEETNAYIKKKLCCCNLRIFARGRGDGGREEKSLYTTHFEERLVESSDQINLNFH